MIITDVRTARYSDAGLLGWSAIERFRNVDYVTKRLIELHRIPKKHHENAKKQALQLRQCLIQAKEYFDAANSVTSATKPVLIYYGILSLALSEVLLKHSGVSSLDNARGQHAHHGLDLRIIDNPSKYYEPADSLTRLRAVPMERADGTRYGTFELWHQSAREYPTSGQHERHFENGTSQTGHRVFGIPRDVRLELLAKTGESLLFCLQNTPGLEESLNDYSLSSHLVRGFQQIETRQTVGGDEITATTIFHPQHPMILNAVYEKVLIHPSDWECITIKDMPAGCIIEQKVSAYFPHAGSSYPNSFQTRKDEVLYCAHNSALNEFGVYYLGMFILGNYVRYYPDMWMRDVENSTPLHLLSSQFLSYAEKRVPILMNSELSRQFTIFD